MKAKDPVCGMSVEVEGAKFVGSSDGQPVYFCCAACQKTYEARRRSG